MIFSQRISLLLYCQNIVIIVKTFYIYLYVKTSYFSNIESRVAVHLLQLSMLTGSDKLNLKNFTCVLKIRVGILIAALISLSVKVLHCIHFCLKLFFFRINMFSVSAEILNQNGNFVNFRKCVDVK